MSAVFILLVLVMIVTWSWAMIRGRPYMASLSAALGIAPVLQLTMGLIAARLVGESGFLSIPVGGSDPGSLGLGISMVFWMAVAGWPSYRLAQQRKRFRVGRRSG